MAAGGCASLAVEDSVPDVWANVRFGAASAQGWRAQWNGETDVSRWPFRARFAGYILFPVSVARLDSDSVDA
eukprot:6274546-Lingulodinium_polyedra.AAC.1